MIATACKRNCSRNSSSKLQTKGRGGGVEKGTCKRLVMREDWRFLEAGVLTIQPNEQCSKPNCAEIEWGWSQGLPRARTTRGAKPHKLFLDASLSRKRFELFVSCPCGMLLRKCRIARNGLWKLFLQIFAWKGRRDLHRSSKHLQLLACVTLIPASVQDSTVCSCFKAIHACAPTWCWLFGFAPVLRTCSELCNHLFMRQCPLVFALNMLCVCGCCRCWRGFLP